MKFRKRITIAPGVRLNLSKRGVSTTIGPRGFNVNVGRRGTYLNTGIPGTGLYDRQRIGGGAGRVQGRATAASAQSASLPFEDIVQVITPRVWQRHFGWVLLAALPAWMFNEWLAAMLAAAGVGMLVARHTTPAGKALNAVLKARKHWQSGNGQLAIESLAQANDLLPLPELDRAAGSIAASMGDNATAIKHLRQLAAPDPDDLMALADSLFNTEQYAEAAGHYRKLLETTSDSGARNRLLYRMAASLFNAGQYRDALIAFQQMQPDKSNENHLSRLIGMCFYKKGDPATAIFTFEKAVGRKRNLDSDLLECCYMLGLIYSEENNRTKARHWFNKVYTRDINYKDVAERLKAIQ
jgi:tetratricopeptide (TPR) repeat protein